MPAIPRSLFPRIGRIGRIGPVICCLICCLIRAAAGAEETATAESSAAVGKDLWKQIRLQGITESVPSGAELKLQEQVLGLRNAVHESDESQHLWMICTDLYQRAWWRGDATQARALMRAADWHAESWAAETAAAQLQLLQHYLATAAWELCFGESESALRRLQSGRILGQQIPGFSPAVIADSVPLWLLDKLPLDQRYQWLSSLIFSSGIPQLSGMNFQRMQLPPDWVLSEVQRANRPWNPGQHSVERWDHLLIMCLQDAVASNQDDELKTLLQIPAQKGNPEARCVIACLDVLRERAVADDWLLEAGWNPTGYEALFFLMAQRSAYQNQLLEILGRAEIRHQYFSGYGQADLLRLWNCLDIEKSTGDPGNLLASDVAVDRVVSLGSGGLAAVRLRGDTEICLPYPIAGEFSVRCRVLCDAGFSGGLGYDGVSMGVAGDGNTISLRSAGNHAPAIRTTPAMESGTLLSAAVLNRSGVLMFEAGGTRLWEAPATAFESSFPWITLHTEGPWPAAWLGVEIIGDPQIPRRVSLSEDPLLRGWSCTESGQTQPVGRSTRSRRTGEKNLPAGQLDWDWSCEEGVIVGRPVQRNSATEPGVLRYLRAMRPSEIIVGEVELGLPDSSCLLAIGRTLVRITANGCEIGWMESGMSGSNLAGLRTGGRLLNSSDRLPFVSGWNRFEIHFADNAAELRVNNVVAGSIPIVKRSLPAFGIVSPPGVSHSRVRGLQLTGNWPSRWPAGAWWEPESLEAGPATVFSQLIQRRIRSCSPP